MSGELDPRVRDRCSQIVNEKDQARMLRLITELNRVLQQLAGQLPRDANTIAAD